MNCKLIYSTKRMSIDNAVYEQADQVTNNGTQNFKIHCFNNILDKAIQ